jgi:hypothetical protein
VTAVTLIATIQKSQLSLSPVVRDPSVIERLTPLVVPYSHVRHPESTDPSGCVVDPIIGLETGSPRLFERFMKGKAYPYKAHQWRDVVLSGMEILNRHNWYPFCTFIIGLPGETPDDTKQSLDLLKDLRDAKGMFVPTFFVPLEDTRMGKQAGARLIEMTDLQWEFFFTCWKYNIEVWQTGNLSALGRAKFSFGVPFYYTMLARRLFGPAIKYPLYRFANFPERLFHKRMYLDLRGRRRNKQGLPPLGRQIVPGFKTVNGLNMVDASALQVRGRTSDSGTTGA